jgi:hypothetical protein
VLKSYDPSLGNYLNSATYSFQIHISSLFHEICYSKIQVIKKNVSIDIQCAYLFYLFLYLRIYVIKFCK